jgi:hypothetical protein
MGRRLSRGSRHPLSNRLDLMPAAIAALRATVMQWVYLNTSSVLTASIAVVGVEGLAVIFEFSMLSPATLPFILLTLAGVHWYRSRERNGLRRMPRL